MQTTKIYSNSQSEQERRAQEYANQLLRERNAKLESLARASLGSEIKQLKPVTPPPHMQRL